MMFVGIYLGIAILLWFIVSVVIFSIDEIELLDISFIDTADKIPAIIVAGVVMLVWPLVVFMILAHATAEFIKRNK